MFLTPVSKHFGILHPGKSAKALTQGTAGVPAVARSQRTAVKFKPDPGFYCDPLGQHLQGGAPAALCVKVFRFFEIWDLKLEINLSLDIGSWTLA
jgi:hypothetical protein